MPGQRPSDPIRSGADRPVEQAEVIAWLSTPGAYGPGIDAVERIDTHTSVVFLVGDRAYKLKRAVRFDYLDYSTLERRRRCCIDEVYLNRRTAPQLYGGVRAVSQAPTGSLALDGWGRAVDYLVDMRRFDTESQFDRLAERGALEVALMPRLADAIASLHDIAELSFEYGGREGMAEVLRGVRAGMRKHGPGVLDLDAAEHLASACFQALNRQAVRLDARREAGFVRHGHGDLHLRNICLLGANPVLFDCIEFNPALACVDVMYDLAFLLMDLLHRGLPAHANAVLNRYVERAEGTGGLALLPLFLASRAAIRAMTHATAVPVQRRNEEAGRLRVEARQYLDLAGTLIAPRAAWLIAIGGPSGSGKSTLARRLAASVGSAPGAVVVRSDVERKRLLGTPSDTRLAASGYTPSVTREVYRVLAGRADAILGSGHGVIVDAVFAEPVDRAAVQDAARANGARFTGLWLDAPLDTLQARINARRSDASDATADVAARQVERLRAPESWAVLDASGDAGVLWRAARDVIDSPPGGVA